MIRSLILTHIQNARQSIKANRTRSILTMLGVTIGIASITTILALGVGATRIIGTQVDALGGNIAVVRPGATTGNLTQEVTQFGAQFAASTLTDADVSAIEEIDHVEAVAPLMVLRGAVSGDTAAPSGTPIVATTPQLETVSGLTIKDGQFLDPSLSNATAVIGAQLAVNTFGTEQSIGKTVTVKGKPFTIIGILKRQHDPINYNNVDFDNAVVLNMESGRELNQGASHIQQINIKSDSVQNLQAIMTNVNQALLRTHFGQADFTVESGDAVAQPTSRIFIAIAGASAAIAAISLIVGGIGIMNIMLVSVVERTREIGIRKALGATSGDIVWQFLIESLALSVGGGIAGYVLGYVLAFGISMFLTFDPVLNWQIAGIALGVSVVVGTLFGLYPAIRAARKDPISALRQYD
jgi:putative ABC transport system permease protein